MASKVVELKLEKAVVETSPLPYEKAEDLIPEVAQLVSRAFDQVSPQVAQMVTSGDLKLSKDDPRALALLLPAISGVIQQLGGGKLKALAPRLLATTTVYLYNDAGEKEKHDLCSPEDRSRCFDARPDIYFQTLFHAGKVTFGRFFPGLGRPAAKAAETTAPSA